MRNLSKILTIVAIVVAVVLIGLAVGWWGSKGVSNSWHADGSMSGDLNTNTETHSAGNPSVARPKPVAMAQTSGDNSNPNTNPIAEVTPGNLITNWEDKLDDILGSDGDDTNKVKELFAMYPRLSEEGQVEVAQHLANLVADEDYAPLARMLRDPKLPEDVQDVLIADILNRPNAIKLPLLLDIAQTPHHAKAEEAKDLLELYLDEDHGTDWAKWRQHMVAWLKENPD